MKQKQTFSNTQLKSANKMDKTEIELGGNAMKPKQTKTKKCNHKFSIKVNGCRHLHCFYCNICQSMNDCSADNVAEFICPKCDKVEIEQGHTGLCKSCYKKNIYYKDHERSLMIQRTSHNKIKERENKRRREQYKIDEHYRLVVKTKTLVAKAIRDKAIERPHYCSKCDRFQTRIEAHHEDYSKPYEIKWLCRRCHAGVHNEK